MAASARIITEHARLRQISDPVEFDAKTRFLARRLMNAATVGRKALGLAAPQIGERKRMFHYNLTPYTAAQRAGLPSKGIVCNPTVLATSDGTWDRYEGCLSFPRKFITVTRPLEATFEWFTLDGERHETTLDAMPCRVWLHETDHLDGILLIDRAAPGAELKTL